MRHVTPRRGSKKKNPKRRKPTIEPTTTKMKEE
jgi:hypothetical protein